MQPAERPSVPGVEMHGSPDVEEFPVYETKRLMSAGDP